MLCVMIESLGVGVSGLFNVVIVSSLSIRTHFDVGALLLRVQKVSIEEVELNECFDYGMHLFKIVSF